MLFAAVLRQLRTLSGALPELENAIRSGMGTLSASLLALAQKAPGGLRALLTDNLTNFFSDGSALLDRVMDFLLKLASTVLSQVPRSALSLATAVISAFMFSVKLPKIRAGVKKRQLPEKFRPWLDTLRHLKSALFGWLKAQLKLSSITWALVTGGFLLLRVRFAPLWALVVAAVDAFPILGTGTILIPWSLVSFFQGDYLRAFCLLGLYLLAVLTRSVLEPRLVGSQLGLDPLVTLMALYVGYRLFGLPGMILAPMLAVTASRLSAARQ